MTGTWLGRVLFALWGAAAVWLLASERYAAFLNPALWPLLVLAGVLAAGFLVAMIALPRGHAVRPDAAWVRTGVLALPLLYVVTGSGETLDTDALESRLVGGVGGLGDAGGLGSLDDIDEDFETHVQNRDVTSVLRIVRSARALEGRDVTTFGQVATGLGEPEGHFVTFRFLVTCCVADARPVGLLVDARGHGVPEKDLWFRVEGTVEATEVDGKPTHVLRAKSLQRIAPPKQPYLYGF